jgi:LacI family transcriptional regulator
VTDFRDGKQASRMLFSRGFQGILLQTHVQPSMLPGMDWNRFSVVGWGEGAAESPESPQPLLSRAIVDHFGSVLRGWDETSKRGYKRIGFALFNLTQTFNEDQVRLGAALTCLRRIPRHRRIPPFVIENKLDTADILPLAEWARRHRPDAVIGFNGIFSWALEKEGFRVPEDLGFISLHTDVDAGNLLGIRHRESGMKEMRMKSMLVAVELLDQQIRHHQYGLPREPRTIMIDSEWIEGDTLPFKVGARA